jgi:putative zinc finger/helix-turn-helix YgiT family protein
MTERMPCSHCGTIRNVELFGRDEKVTIKGREISFTAHFSRCTTCGDEVEAPGQLDANLDAAREAYARLYESPAPAALVALRSRYGASQKAFGSILGFGELTMNNYEKGAPPDTTNRLLIKLADDPSVFKAMYGLNKGKIGAIQRQRIESSEGFKSAMQWSGLETLSTALSSVQKEKIETCAERNGRSVPEQVAAYVGAASFQDYSRLMVEAIWSEGVPTQLPTVPATPSSSFQAAS